MDEVEKMEPFYSVEVVTAVQSPGMGLHTANSRGISGSTSSLCLFYSDGAWIFLHYFILFLLLVPPFSDRLGGGRWNESRQPDWLLRHPPSK